MELEKHGRLTVLESILSRVVENAERDCRLATSPMSRLEDVHMPPNAIRGCLKLGDSLLLSVAIA
jgi:hypothetical protein